MRRLSIPVLLAIFLASPVQTQAINFSSTSKAIAKFFTKTAAKPVELKEAAGKSAETIAKEASTNPEELKAAAGKSAETRTKQADKSSSSFHIPPQVGVRAAQQTVNNTSGNDEQNKKDILVNILWGIIALSVLYFAFKLLKYVFVKIKSRNIVRIVPLDDGQIAGLTTKTGFANKAHLLFLRSKRLRILNVPVVYIVVVSFLLYAFAYEKGTYGRYAFKKNRYTGKVYVQPAAYPDSEWVETNYRSIDDAISSTVRNEFLDEMADLDRELSNLRQEQRMRDIRNSYNSPAYIPPITSYTPPSFTLPPSPAPSHRVNDEYKYASPATGAKYKYDLSRPSDALRYELDLSAQMRDEINPKVMLDRNMGYGGGGIK